MARSAVKRVKLTKSRRKALPKSRPAKSDWGWEPHFSFLMKVEFAQSVDDHTYTEPESDDEKQNRYSLLVHSLSEEEEFVAATCELSLEKKSNEAAVLELTAVYVFSFKTERRDRKSLKRIAMDCAKAFVWPRFDDLFGVMINQGYLDLPRLPAVAQHVHFVDDEN